jgi:hypothetical protein
MLKPGTPTVAPAKSWQHTRHESDDAKELPFQIRREPSRKADFS